jgi:phenylacetate-CoA ligase
MIYNEEFETLPREALEALQVKRLQQVVQRVYHTVGFYKRTFDNAGIKPDDIKSLDDLKRLPFTTKQDLRDNYPYGLFAVPMSSVVRVHASSGTTGRSTVVGYTKRDIDTWSELMARCFVMAGLTKNDIIHNAYGYGLFTGGLGAHYGAEKLGASVIPMSGGNTKRQIMILQDFGPTAICATPSYTLYLAEQGEEMGVDMRSLKLRVGVLGAEPWSEDASKSRTSSTSRPLTSMGSPRSWDPVFPWSAPRPSRGSMSSKTTSSPRSSTPIRARCCPRVRSASWSSRRSPRRPSRSSVTARETFRAS